MATVSAIELSAAIHTIGKAGISPEKTIDGSVLYVSISFKENRVVFEARESSFYLQIEVEALYKNFAEEVYYPVCVSHRSLERLLHKIKGKKVTLKCGGIDLDVRDGTTVIPVTGGEGLFPVMADLIRLGNPKGEVCIDRKHFKDVIGVCGKYAGTNHADYILTGINIFVDGSGKVQVEAADRHSMIMATFPAKSENSFCFIIPSTLPAKILKQKWKTLKMTVYQKGLTAIDETGKIRFHSSLLEGVYPDVFDKNIKQTLFSHTMSSTIKLHDLLFFLEEAGKSCSSVILLSESTNFRIHGVSTTSADIKECCFARNDENKGVSWASLCIRKLLQVCTSIPKAAMNIRISIAKNKTKEQLVVAIDYQHGDCSFVIGIAQLAYNGAPYHKLQELLVELYSVPERDRQSTATKFLDRLKNAKAEPDSAPDDAIDTFNVTHEFFPEEFFETDDRPDDDIEPAE